MGALYVIGNGFDLHFGLATRTCDFFEYLEEQSIFDEVENALEVLHCYGVDWHEYEQSLNDIDLDEIENQNEIYPDYLSDHESDRDDGITNMQMYVDSISDAICSALNQMVLNANEKAEELRGDYYNETLFKAGDAILSFNYTSTIEYLFHVPKAVPIFHIHGKYEQGDSLIFGYRKNSKSYSHAWYSQDDDFDYYIGQQREIVYDFYQSWEKKLQINSLDAFLNQCHRVNQIIVLGHSMSAVDSEYMEQIEKIIAPDTWKISIYQQDDIDRIRGQNYSFENKIEYIRMEDVII